MKQTAACIAAAFCFAGIIVWQIFFSDKLNYYAVSVCVLLISMLPFFVSFEHKKENAADITLTATMIALAVVSRAVFYLIPQVKPIAAVVIIAAVCLGPTRGFVIGAFSAFVSNFIFGQGFWTPFQMVALGLVGLVSGLIFMRLKVNRFSLAAVGFVLAFALYGIVVDASTVLVVCGDEPTLAGVLSVYASGIPFSAVFGASTAAFLFLFGKPFEKKVERIITKYNLAR